MARFTTEPRGWYTDRRGMRYVYVHVAGKKKDRRARRTRRPRSGRRLSVSSRRRSSMRAKTSTSDAS